MCTRPSLITTTHFDKNLLLPLVGDLILPPLTISPYT